MKGYHVVIFMIIGLFALSACTVEDKSNDYTEFDFESVPDSELTDAQKRAAKSTSGGLEVQPEQEVPVEKEVSGGQVEKNDAMLSCVADSDCVIVQPDTCCACPLSINRFFDGDLDTIAVGKEPACGDDILCGACAEHDSLTPKCVDRKCTAEHGIVKQVVETFVDNTPAPVDIVSYEHPELTSSSNFEFMEIKEACFQNRNAIYFRYNVKMPTIVELEVRREGKSVYEPVWVNDRDLYKGETTLVLCDGCIINNYGTAPLDDTVYVRLRSEFDGDVTYAGDYKFDTSNAGEYLQKAC